MLKAIRIGYCWILLFLLFVVAMFFLSHSDPVLPITLVPQPDSTTNPNVPEKPVEKPVVPQPTVASNGTKPAVRLGAPVTMNATQMLALIKSRSIKKTNHAFLTITYGNWANVDMVLNWAKSFNNCMPPEHRDKFLVIALDKLLYDELQRKAVPSVMLRELVPSRGKEQLAGVGTFGTEQFNSITKNKFWIVYTLLETYKTHVFFSDSDVAFMSSKMFDYLDHVMYQVPFASPHNHDMAFSSDSSNKYHSSYYGTGFFFALASNFSIQLCKRVAEANLASGNLAKKIFDADVLNNLAGPMRTNRIHVLPFMLFPNGYVGDNKGGLLFDLKPWLYHANYLVGNTAKKAFLVKHNAWFLPYNRTLIE
jgi:hypothetical protein